MSHAHRMAATTLGLSREGAVRELGLSPFQGGPGGSESLENLLEADLGSEPSSPDAVTRGLSTVLQSDPGSALPEEEDRPAHCMSVLCAWGVESRVLGPALLPSFPLSARPVPSQLGPSVLLVASGGGPGRSVCSGEPWTLLPRELLGRASRVSSSVPLLPPAPWHSPVPRVLGRGSWACGSALPVWG